VREAKSQFISRSDALRSFLDEECKLGPDEWIAKTDLYQAYRRHAQDNGSKVMSNREFYSRVEQIDGIDERIRNGTRGFAGVRLIGIDDWGQKR
jgi:phage/plasmid-associated DNA primase